MDRRRSITLLFSIPLDGQDQKIIPYPTVYADDYLVILAWAMLLASSVSWQIESTDVDDQYDVSSGRKPFTPEFIQSNLRSKDLVVVYTEFPGPTWVACVAEIHYKCSLGSSETIYGRL